VGYTRCCSVLQRVAACCSVLQCVMQRVLQCVAVCCSVLQFVAVRVSVCVAHLQVRRSSWATCSVAVCVAVCIVECLAVCVAVYVLQCVAVCCRVCCSALQRLCLIACYGVSTICRLLKMTGLFCKRAL